MSRKLEFREWLLISLAALGIGYMAWDMLVPKPDATTILSWTAPTLDERNEPLTDLAGYNIHCWAEAGRYYTTIHVEDPALTSNVIHNLKPGTYLCAISAIDQDGGESALSNVVARSVP